MLELESLVLDESDVPLPGEFEDYLEQAETVAAVLLAQRHRDHVLSPSYYPSDTRQTWRHLAWLIEQQSLTGCGFCEWGGGLATASSAAACLGMTAWSVEADSRLVREAQRLLEPRSWSVRITQASFVPTGWWDRKDATPAGMEGQGPSIWDGSDESTDEVAVVYGYPWPGTVAHWLDLFGHVAPPGCFLLCFCGAGEYRLWRKTSVF